MCNFENLHLDDLNIKRAQLFFFFFQKGGGGESSVPVSYIWSGVLAILKNAAGIYPAAFRLIVEFLVGYDMNVLSLHVSFLSIKTLLSA